MASEEQPYQPRDVIDRTIKAVMVVGGAGTVLSAIQNSLTRQNVGALGFITRTGGTIGTFAALGAGYAFTSTAAANLREKDDAYNEAIGGFFGGSVIGLSKRSFPKTLGYGAGLAIVLSAFKYTGGGFSRHGKDYTKDNVEAKDALRNAKRIPMEQTLSEIGEGRGIYPEGYEERRRARIKEKYGIDLSGVPPAH
ncbi:NADH-ubiquinone oxidoreductase 213 kDa subunit [Lineolata rhizophorae]|uniref:NADH-ubiquinone oxidoreductase 213 kDa subunit n=1 Tax=Lineolata rhizophorae TaxID=578093 RepID=A0A6A6P6L7_9PEZI|nr:NADH-ubiquinone oxidoreductase 213 kDa subunit [Lineolata rhizophorae]